LLFTINGAFFLFSAALLLWGHAAVAFRVNDRDRPSAAQQQRDFFGFGIENANLVFAKLETHFAPLPPSWVLIFKPADGTFARWL
jgi:hypothetical protein